MKKKLPPILLLGLTLLTSTQCDSTQKAGKGEMIVTGNIEGLRKGTLYLQKFIDTLLTSIDSVTIKGTPTFSFVTKIESPELYYLSLTKDDGDSLKDRIAFFGEPGEIAINTRLKTFETSAKVVGSENQNLYREYQSYIRKFNNQQLDLLEDYLDFQQAQEMIQADSIQKAMDNLIRRKYLYAINFASNHADKEIAPFIALAEVFDANLTLLDTLSSRMTPEVADSKYGRKLITYLEERRKAKDSSSSN
ncbi:MAG: DUF4369 domain-containing protein [Flavobacteriaceae bacterium]